MSRKELNRVEVMGRVKARSLRWREAAELLELSYRQSKRIWARYQAGGAMHCNMGTVGEFRTEPTRRSSERGSFLLASPQPILRKRSAN